MRSGLYTHSTGSLSLTFLVYGRIEPSEQCGHTAAAQGRAHMECQWGAPSPNTQPHPAPPASVPGPRPLPAPGSPHTSNTSAKPKPSVAEHAVSPEPHPVPHSFSRGLGVLPGQCSQLPQPLSPHRLPVTRPPRDLQAPPRGPDLEVAVSSLRRLSVPSTSPQCHFQPSPRHCHPRLGRVNFTHGWNSCPAVCALLLDIHGCQDR